MILQLFTFKCRLRVAHYHRSLHSRPLRLSKLIRDIGSRYAQPETAVMCRDETRTSEHVGISPAEEGWIVTNDNEMYLVAALTCNVLQHPCCHLSVQAP
jgi:hypothetical protein